MLELQTKQFYVQSVESDLNNLKSNSDTKRVAENILFNIKKHRENDSRYYEEVFNWLWNAMESETEQRDVDSLTLDQTRYAMGIVSAITDCVTLVI